MKIRPSIAYSLIVTVPSILFFSSLAVILYPLDWIFLRKRQLQGKWGATVTVVKLGWGYWMLWAHGIKVKVSGPAAQDLKKMKGVIFVLNHQSVTDIMTVIKILPKASSFISKKELRSVPVFGWAMKVVGTLFVDRSRGTQNQALSEVNDLMRDGFNIIIFAEGTRSPDGKLLPFKRGAFVMAIEAQVPVVPVTILDSRLCCPKGQLAIAPGTIHVIADNPISTKGLKIEDRHQLSDQVRHIMLKHLEKFEENRETS